MRGKCGKNERRRGNSPEFRGTDSPDRRELGSAEVAAVWLPPRLFDWGASSYSRGPFRRKSRGGTLKTRTSALPLRYRVTRFPDGAFGSAEVAAVGLPPRLFERGASSHSRGPCRRKSRGGTLKTRTSALPLRYPVLLTYGLAGCPFRYIRACSHADANLHR